MMENKKLERIVERVVDRTIRRSRGNRILFVILDIAGGGCGAKVNLDTNLHQEWCDGGYVEKCTLTDEQVVKLLIATA